MGLAQGCIVQATILGPESIADYFASARVLLKGTDLVA